MPNPEPAVRRHRVLIAGQDQFGQLTDSYQFVRYLREQFDVTFVGWEFGLPHVPMEGVTLVHFDRTGGKIRRYFAFLARLLRLIWREKYDLVFLLHFPGAGLYPLLAPGREYVLDIRTGYIKRNPLVRNVLNAVISADSLFFRHMTVISESLRRVLNISQRKAHILPLGADMPEYAPKEFTSMRLFYVGSLEARHIDRTVDGFARFYRDTAGRIPLSYDIVGFGPPDAEERLRQSIAASGCADAVTFHGRVPYTGLGPYLERATVGVAFIPLAVYYQCQPATKLFEYMLAGMPVVATSTWENARVVNDANGVLIPDSAEGMAEGLRRLSMRLSTYDSQTIRATVAEYTWVRIVRENLAPYLLTVLNETPAKGTT